MTNEAVVSEPARVFDRDRSGSVGGTRPHHAPLRRLDAEDGYVLAMTALLMLPLMVFVSFAIDLGVWYGEASRMQRAADAASLAAVVWLPNETKATQTYIDVARQNGFVNGPDVTVTGTPVGPTRYRVSITGKGERLFSSSFRNDDQDIGRTSTAEFNKPVPMGSPTSKIGNDLSDPSCRTRQFMPATAAPCGPNSMLWSSIQGPYELFENGDPYTTVCARNVSPVSASNCSGSGRNTLYKPNGYEFGIEVGQADVGKTLTLQFWDPGHFSRRAGAGVPSARSLSMTRVGGSRIINRASGQTYTFTFADLGQSITGTGIPANSIIVRVISTTQIEISQPLAAPATNNGATSSGTSTLTVGQVYDCNSDNAPFNANPYLSLTNRGASSQTCQTGDSWGVGSITSTSLPAGSAFQAQVYDNDGVDLTNSFTTPLPNCELYIARGTLNWYHKNNWVQACQFVPTQKGVYPIRVKSSNITLANGTVVPDSGSGWNAFSVRVTGGTTGVTRLYALDDLSIWTNTPGSSAQFYLAEIGQEHAGKRLLLDLYDPGDGSGSTANYTMQVRRPPSGSPAIVPSTGTTIPTCAYNATGSATKGPATPQSSTNCTITTRSGGSNLYNNNWLRIEIPIPTNYTCSTDCWWTIKYDFGGAGTPNDRTVWSIKVVGDPVHLVE